MGYVHYYYVSEEFDAEAFAKVAVDFKKMVTSLKHLGVILAGSNGEDYPTISPTEICFNGLKKCGHAYRNFGDTSPSETAKGVLKNGADTQITEIVKSAGLCGVNLETRACGGDCSHDTFILQQKLKTKFECSDGSVITMEAEEEYCTLKSLGGKRYKNPENEVGKYFHSTKTAYKPYDLAVNVCLIIAKHYLGKDIVIRSDGKIDKWHEAMQLCQHFLGYGLEFNIDDDDEDTDNTVVEQLDEGAAGIAIIKISRNEQGEETVQKFFLKLGEGTQESTDSTDNNQT